MVGRTDILLDILGHSMCCDFTYCRGVNHETDKKIKVKDGKIFLEWHVDKNGGFDNYDTYTMECREQARPELYEALHKLAEEMRKICELPNTDEERKRLCVKGVSYAYNDKEGIMGAVLIGSRELYDSVAPLNVNTPCLWEAAKDEKQEMTQDMYDLLYELQEECQKYISGDRAQMSLFKKEEDHENKTTA